MEAVKRNTTLPVTVKTRLGYDEDSMNAIELGRAAEALGLKWICFHGRTRRQQYAGTADYAAIGRLKAAVWPHPHPDVRRSGGLDHHP